MQLGTQDHQQTRNSLLEEKGKGRLERETAYVWTTLGGGRWKEKRRSNMDSHEYCKNTNYPALKTHLYESLIHTTDRAEEVGNINNVVNFKPQIKV